MKRIVPILLTVLLAVSMSVPTFAAVEKSGAKAAANTVTATIPAISAKAPVVDGKVSAGEYQQIPVTAEDLHYYADSEALYAPAENSDFKMYAAYSVDTFYLAVTVKTPDFVMTGKSNEMYRYHCLQFGVVKLGETGVKQGSEFIISRHSDSGELMVQVGRDTYEAKFTPVGGKDFNVVTENGITTYEIAFPAKCFGQDTLKKGDQLRMGVISTLSQNATTRSVVEWGNAIYTGGREGAKYPVITLGDAPKAPESATTTAPVTADAVSIAVAALAISAAAAVVISKKH